MALLKLSFTRDCVLAMKIMKKHEYLMWRLKTAAAIKSLRACFTKNRSITCDDGGFSVIGEGSEDEIRIERKKMEDVLSGDDWKETISKELHKHHLKAFQRLFNRPGTTPLLLLNSIGIMVNWEESI